MNLSSKIKKSVAEWFYLTESECNTGRQLIPDIAKGLAIVWMVPSHTLGTLSFIVAEEPVYGSTAFFDCILAGHWAAPVFMFCMGVGIMYSRKLTPGYLAIRGLKIFGLSLLLNFLRFIIPYLFSLAYGNGQISIGWGGVIDISAGFDLRTVAALFFYQDILGFAGLVMILLAPLFALKVRPFSIFVFGVCLSVAGTFLGDCSTGNVLADEFRAYFVTTNQSSFALLGWTIFPAAGIFFGSILKRCTCPSRFFIKAGITVLPLSLVYIAVMVAGGSYYPFSQFGEYGLTIGDAIGGLCLGFLLFALLALLVKVFPHCEWSVLRRYSRNITSMYFIHWVIIGLLIIGIYLPIRGLCPVNESLAILFGFPLLLLSDFLAVIWSKIGKRGTAVR